MSRSARDLLYRIYIIIHVFATSLLTVPVVLPRSMVPEICFKPLQWYLANYNDPLVGKKGFPGGWFGGFSVCEAWLQLPYFLWAIMLPIGQHADNGVLTS
jgi:EXPERA (EXPanded EBP superfamily)